MKSDTAAIVLGIVIGVSLILLAIGLAYLKQIIPQDFEFTRSSIEIASKILNILGIIILVLSAIFIALKVIAAIFQHRVFKFFEN
jgi:predicted MPP superfamily phosphohydrolase